MSVADRVALRAKDDEVLHLKFRVIELRAALEGMMRYALASPTERHDLKASGREAVAAVADVVL